MMVLTFTLDSVMGAVSLIQVACTFSQVILVDMDGVIADLERQFLDLWRTRLKIESFEILCHNFEPQNDRFLPFPLFYSF